MPGIKVQKKKSPPRREGKAACRNHDPEMWQRFSKKLTAENHAAIRICLTQCPIRDWCLETALSDAKSHKGEIWGGELF